ncbi:MAG: amino acid racemase [Pirellulales bacterium]|nr:amino acid racemase [Pirellulales bacterium]
MRHIGLVGGLSPESTVHYYRTLCGEFNQRVGALNFPNITLRSLNLQELTDLFQRNDWQGVAAILLDALGALKKAGAEFAAILANTPHNAYDLIRDESPLKIVTIMGAVSQALLRDGRRKVALLGTRRTMEFGFFRQHFESRGIEMLVPAPPQRQELDRVIWSELSHGLVRPGSRLAVIHMMKDLAQQGADAVILGCTELQLLVRATDSPRPLYDTTRIHAEAILEYAMQ